MTHYAFVLLLLVGSSLCMTPVAAPDQGQDDAKLIQGTWIPIQAELGGKEMPEEVRKSIKLILKGDTYTAFVGDKPDAGTCKLDPTKNPKTLDILGTDGPNKGKTILTIYELKGDTLKVCYDLSGKGRPTEFNTKGGPQHYLVTYQRVTAKK
jgi:uncharacterized protein (TIGR03067 family)